MTIKNRYTLSPLSMAVFSFICQATEVPDRNNKVLLEEIVITSEKFEKKLQEVPLAVSVLLERDIELRKISDLADLSGKVPGLNVAKSEGYRRPVTLRGAGNESPQNAGSRPGVSFHVDGVFIPEDAFLTQDFLDVTRIEVVRGPQGTLFGQNSTGGTINVITGKPIVDFNYGDISYTVGDYNTNNFEGNWNLPISRAMAARFSYGHREHDGYTKNLAIPGHDLDDADNDKFRAQLLWAPSPNFSALFAWQRFENDINGPAQKGTLDFSSNDPRKLSHDLKESYSLSNDMFSATFEWDLQSAMVKAILSKQTADMDRVVDGDRTALTANDPAPLPQIGAIDTLGEAPIRENYLRLRQEFDHKTAEINISSVPQKHATLDWIAGIFYLDGELGSNTLSFADFGRDGDPLNLNIPTGNVFANADIDFINDDIRRRDSYSVYGQTTWHFTRDLRGIIGFRYTEDKVDNDACSFNCLNTRQPRHDKLDDEATTGKLALEYDLADAHMAYFSISRGYKPGGANSTFNDFVENFYDAETITAYEFGTKSLFNNNRYRLNTALFYYDYQDYQFAANAAAPFSGGISNIPKSTVMGAEFEFTAYLTRGLKIDSSFAWMHSEVKSNVLAIDGVDAENISTPILMNNGSNVFDPAVAAARGTVARNLKGNELSKTPKFVANLVLSYRIDFESLGRLTSSVDYTFRDEFQYRIFNNPNTDTVDSYSLVGLNFLFEPEAAPWSAELIVQNLTDKDAVNATFTDNFAVSATSQEFTPPRVILARFNYEF